MARSKPDSMPPAMRRWIARAAIPLIVAGTVAMVSIGWSHEARVGALEVAAAARAQADERDADERHKLHADLVELRVELQRVVRQLERVAGKLEASER